MAPKPALVVVIAALAVAAARPASADVQLSMRNGRVTIVASGATLRQIMMEWGRVGQTRIVNVERIPGPPLTIELRDVPEETALKILLRAVSGYLAAPRARDAGPGTSVFDRIIVMPTLAASAAPPLAAPTPASAPTFPQPTYIPPQPSYVPPPGNQEAGSPLPGGPGARNPVFVFSPPQTGPPAGAPIGVGGFGAAAPGQPPSAPVLPPAASFPGAPTAPSPNGVAIPGMVVPAPAQPPVQLPIPAPTPQG